MSKPAGPNASRRRIYSPDPGGSPAVLRVHVTTGTLPQMVQALVAESWQGSGPPFRTCIVKRRCAALDLRLLAIDEVQDGRSLLDDEVRDGRTMLDPLTWIRALRPGGNPVPVSCASHAGEEG